MLNLHINTIIYCVLLFPVSACCAEFSITLKSTSGKEIKDAVVTLTPDKKQKLKSKKTYIIDQINKTYVPHIKIIPTGSNINFPNKDNIRHHVYSFSDTKKFELPLYEGTPTNPVNFSKAGIVTLGCNIHDWMSAYIYITDTPYYALTGKSGNITIKNIPQGKYTLQIWHPRLKNSSANKPVKIALSKNEKTSQQTTLALKPSFKIRRAPKAKRRRY